MGREKAKREIDLEKLKVALVTDYHDRETAETILSRYHPLGARKAQGCRLCYSVSYRGRWLAVLLFDAPVKRNKHREARIGWSDTQREQRLCHIANNSRYVLSPLYAGTKNLASKILSLVTERLSADWLRRYGVPILAVETYVDPEHNNNSGTCYTAAGWENLGYSTGYQAYGEERTHSKWYFLKGLHKDSFSALKSEIPRALLTGVKEVSGKSNNNYVLDASKFNLDALRAELSAIPDPRGKQGRRYRFVPLLSLCIAAVISGYTQYRQIADWIKKLPATERVRFGLPGDMVPDETTIGNLLRRIDPVKFHTVLSGWLVKTYKKDVEVSTVLMDGKAQRGTSSNAKQQQAFLNVFANELGIVIEHKPTEKGGGEKITAREVLRGDIALEGKTVLADAIHTDRALLQELKKKAPRMSSLSRAIRRV